MPDIFDSITLDPPGKKKRDVFDELELPAAPAAKGDIFDQLEIPAPATAPAPIPVAAAPEPAAPPAPIPAKPLEPAPELSPAMQAYRKALDAYLRKDEAGVEPNLAEAERLDPNLLEAQGMRRRVNMKRAAGKPLFEAEPPPAPAPAVSDPLADAAAAAARATQGAAPALPQLPRTPKEAVEAALLPVLSLSAPLRSEEGKRLEGAAAAGAAGSAAAMAGAVPALEAFAGIETPVGKAAQRAADRLGALAQELMPDDPNFAEQLASGAGSMALFMVPGTAAGGAVSAIPRMGVVAARLAPALSVGLPVVLESATEAGGVFQQALLAGKNREEAGQAAAKTFWANALLVGLTNRFGLDAQGRAALMKAIASAPMEGLQEAGQSIISDLAAGDPVNWNEVAVSLGVGSILGGALGGLRADAPPTPISAGQGAPPAKVAASGPSPASPPPLLSATPAAAPAPAASSRLVDVMDVPAMEALAERFPSVVKAAAAAPVPVPRETLTQALQAAAAAGDAALAQTRDPMAADAAALEVFQQSTGTAPTAVAAAATPAPDIFDQIQLPEEATPAAEPVPAPLPAPEEGARLTKPPLPGGFVPREAVLTHARALHRAALEERESRVTPLERFIIEQGGVRGIKREGEEFRAVPVHLRGPAVLDEVETDARAAGVLGPNEDLYTAIQALPRRGPRPALTDFIEQAQRELENEYEVYGAPQESMRAAPGAEEVVPFERGPEYSASGSRPEGGPGPAAGPPRAEFLGWQPGFSDLPPQPLYNIRGRHPRTGSTVGKDTLERLGIQVPETPPFEEWQKQRKERGLGETQPDFFGGAAPATRARPEAEAPGQQSLFGPMARPQFEPPRPNAQAHRLAQTSEGAHQVELQVPVALQESVVIKDLAEQGFLAVPKMKIEAPEDTAAIFSFLKNQTVESFYVISMDEKDQILGAELVSVGILDSTLVHPRDALKGATLLGAKRVALIHNHPSGNPTPSQEDLKLTRNLTKAAAGVGIEVKHHIVINDTEFGVIEGGKSEVRQRAGAAAPEGGRVRLVKPTRSSAATGESLKNSEAVVEFAKAFQQGRDGVVAIALNTKLQPTGVWYMGHDYLGAERMAAEVGKIAMRNNAYSIIFSSARMPSPSYVRALNAELAESWGVPILDVTAPGQPGTPGVESARGAGLLRDEQDPYAAAAPGMTPEESLKVVKRVEKAQARELERARLPSRQGMPPRYTEAQALRVALQREAKAAAAAAARTKEEADYELRFRMAEAEKIADIEAGRARAEGEESGLAQGRRMAGEAQVRGRREGAYSQRWFEAERNRIRTDLATQVEGLLPPEERGRFIRAVATAQSPKDLAKAAIRMDQALARFQKRTLIGRIKRNFDRVVASKAIAVDYVGRVRGLMSDILLAKPRQETLQRAAETQRVINQARERGQRVDVPQYVLDKIKALAAQPLIDMPVAKVEDLLDQIKRLADLGKTKLEAMQAIDSAQKEADMADILAGSEPISSAVEAQALPGEDLPTQARAANVFRRAFNRAQNAHYAITPMDVIFDVLDGSAGFTGPNYRIFKARVDNAFGTYLDEAARFRDEARARAKALGLTDKNMERIGVYAIDIQEGGRQKLYNSGLSDEDIGAIQLTPAEASFYRYMRQHLDGLRPRIADTMRRVYNAELGQVPNYFPFVTDWDQMSEQDLRDRMLTEMTGLRKNPEMGFTKARKGAGTQKVDLNALDVYLKHVDDAAYLVNVGPEAKYLGELAKADQYQAAAGNVGQRIVREWVDTIARKGGGFGDQQIRVLDFLRRNVGLAALGLRVSSAAVQPTAILQGGALIGPRVFQGMADLGRSRAWRQFVLDSFPELRERAGDDIAFLDFNGESARDKAGRMMMWPLQKLDILAARSVAAGAYRKYLADHDIPLDLEQPNKDAVAYAQRVVRRTQSTSSFKDAPQALTRGRLTGNRSLDRALLQFQSFILNNWSLLTHEGVRAGAAKGKVAQGANVALWSLMAVMAATGIRGAVRDLFGDDDRDYWKEVAKDLVSNVPFVSNVMSAFYGRELAPGVDVLRRAVAGGARMAMGRRPETRAKGALDLAAGLSTLTPFPIPSQAVDFAKKAVAGGAGGGRSSRQARPRAGRSREVVVR